MSLYSYLPLFDDCSSVLSCNISLQAAGERLMLLNCKNVLNLSIPKCLVLQLIYREVGCSHYILASQVRVGLRSIYNV